MRFALLSLTLLSLVAMQSANACAQDLAVAPPIPHRSQSSQKRSATALISGRRLQIGEERHTVEIAPQSGRMIHAGKTREFRSIVGLQPIAQPHQPWLAPLTDDLVIQTPRGSKEYVLPWDKIAKITVGRWEKGTLGPMIQIATRAGKTETFGGVWYPHCGVEIEWVDSIARERFSLAGSEGAVIELDEPTFDEKEELPK